MARVQIRSVTPRCEPRHQRSHKEHDKDTITMTTSLSVIARRAALTASKRVPPCTTFIKCLSSNSGKLPDEEYYEGECSLVRWRASSAMMTDTVGDQSFAS